MATMSKVGDGLKATILMVVVQVIFSGINIMYKLAATDGMDLRVLVAYRFLFGAAFIVPVAFFLERKKRPKLTWKVSLFALLCGLFGGALGQNLMLESLVLTSATFSAAMVNLIPGITFIVAVCLRLENLGWHTLAGKAKVLGTLMGIGGAMLFTFYKGPNITIWETNFNLMKITSHHPSHAAETGNLALGVILAIVSCVFYSLWLIIQAKAAAVYPCPQSFTALVVFFASLFGTVSALCMQRDWSQWKLGWDIRLLTVAYAGIVGSGIMFVVIAQVVGMRGPVFVSVFNPLLLIFVAIVGSLVLDEKLYLGSLLGGILIIAALFVVSWGKSKEIKKITQPVPEEDTSIEDQEREKSSDRNNDQLVQEQKNVSIESHADQIEITITNPK
ncbi:WAT1-related protein At1g68170-like [Coffea arabica]|uniref:WAT1-related protein n=1 Tax=Coffea arabica TaxID=13443 RepID=A0ABM4WVJ6_COFAR